jgi:hypothetical protein
VWLVWLVVIGLAAGLAAGHKQTSIAACMDGTEKVGVRLSGRGGAGSGLAGNSRVAPMLPALVSSALLPWCPEGPLKRNSWQSACVVQEKDAAVARLQNSQDQQRMTKLEALNKRYSSACQRLGRTKTTTGGRVVLEALDAWAERVEASLKEGHEAKAVRRHPC